MASGRSLVPVAIVVLGIAVLAATAVLGFQLGRYKAGYSAIDERNMVRQYEIEVADLKETVDGLRSQVAILETSREVDRETYDQVEHSLGTLQARIQAQEEQLAFYRSIVSPEDGVSGLRVQELSMIAGAAPGRYRMRLVLIQAIVQSEPVAGNAILTIEGRLNGDTVRFGLDELTADGQAGSLAYEFMYFESIERELLLPDGFQPTAINLELKPDGSRDEAVTRSFEWSEVTEA